MRVTIEWLEELLGEPLKAAALADQLTLSGLEVEAIAESPIGPVLDVAITPNRGDCLSVVGLAQEIGAITGRPFKRPMRSAPRSRKGGAAVQIKEPGLCSRYCGQLMEQVQIRPAPAWMQQRLEACGIRSINNVVDITNYVMLERGQPLHAFDAACLVGGGIQVRRARRGEGLITLDGKERRLGSDDLVIADDKTPVALAGVMGGLSSEVSDRTQRLFLESAYFDALTVRRTSKRLGLPSESSYRFERGVDWFGVRSALERMVELLQEHADARPVGSITDVFKKVPVAVQIRLDSQRVGQLLGGKWSVQAIERPLKNLGCQIAKGKGKQWRITVPSRRHDLKEPVDLIEEVARLNGYDRIVATAPPRPVRVAPYPHTQRQEAELRRQLATLGFAECIYYGFCSEAELKNLGEPWLPLAPQLANPLSEEMAYLRPTLTLSLLKGAQYHQNRQMMNLRLFELRSTFQKEASQIEERRILSGLLGGEAEPSHWSRRRAPCDFYEAKGVVESLLQTYRAAPLNWSPLESGNPYTELFHPRRSAELLWEEHPIGVVGELHPEREAAFELKGPIYLFELDWQDISRLESVTPVYQPIPMVPWVERDLAVVVDEGVTAKAVESVIKEQNEEMIRNLLIFDTYRGSQIPEGRKSLAFRYQIGHPERTLTDEEVEALQAKIVLSLKKKLQAEIR